MSFFSKAKPLVATLAFASLFGCANDPAPSEQLKLSEQAVAQAKAVGATEEEPDMASAETKLGRAQADMVGKSYKDARMLAEQAELDARLAESQVLTQKSEEQLVQMNSRLNRLRKQLGEAQ